METWYNKKGISGMQVRHTSNIYDVNEETSIDDEINSILKEAEERMLREFSEQLKPKKDNETHVVSL